MQNTDAFEAAVRGGSTGEVRRLLEASPALADGEIGGLSPVLVALFAGHEETGRLLAERRTAIGVCEAAALGSVEALRQAAGAGAEADGDASVEDPGSAADAAEDLNAPAVLGWTPLHLSAFLGRREATAWLLGRGADPVARSDNAEANTPLHAALAGRNDLEVIRLLLEGGADPEALASLGVTPLHLAASRGNGDAVDALLGRGARPAPMEDGRMPSDLAGERGHPELARRLERLEAGSAGGA